MLFDLRHNQHAIDLRKKIGSPVEAKGTAPAGGQLIEAVKKGHLQRSSRNNPGVLAEKIEIIRSAIIRVEGKDIHGRNVRVVYFQLDESFVSDVGREPGCRIV